jgi:6-phosphogluconolactonase/glucosamine-6-phosphate isomerase/deaminase
MTNLPNQPQPTTISNNISVYPDLDAISQVAGESKAKAVAAVLHGPRQPEKWPVQRIRPENGPENGRLRWLLDKAAATKIDQ